MKSKNIYTTKHQYIQKCTQGEGEGSFFLSLNCETSSEIIKGLIQTGFNCKRHAFLKFF